MASAPSAPSAPPAAATTATTAPAPRPGLRERKKLRTRNAIRHAACRLFQLHGYDATSVDRIAAAAELSPSTVFRYFPAKEDILLPDAYGPGVPYTPYTPYGTLMERALRARPVAEPPPQALRHAIVAALRETYEGAEGTAAGPQEPEPQAREPEQAQQTQDAQEPYERLRLACAVPAVRARMADSGAATARRLARTAAERCGQPADDPELRVYAGALLGATTEALLCWGESGRGEGLVEAVARSLEGLERGLGPAAD